jgi:hypothetical protein
MRDALQNFDGGGGNFGYMNRVFMEEVEGAETHNCRD